MKRAFFAALPLTLLGSFAQARGVSPYLPLNLDPDIERRIERLLILADKPVLTRPIAAATVLEALPKACARDAVLCEEVRRYLARYMRNWGVTDVRLEVATSSGSDNTIPNRHGLTTSSDYVASAQGFWQPHDYALLSVGAVAYEGEVIPQGSLLSVGFDRAQLDLGYRGHWLSPFTDSSMLIGSEAVTMPSITLSNYVPLTRWAFHYEAFGALMSESQSILFQGTRHTGRPRVAGLHLSMEPAHGWSVGVNRVLQYGGGPRAGGFKDLLRGLFDPSRYDNISGDLSNDQEFGNQLASVTSQFLFPATVPIAVYVEYAGEDTSNGKNYLLGNASLSAGIRIPQLWRRFDLTYEVSEWQNGWYVNSLYGDGLTNKGHVLGHWGGDNRAFGNAVGAQSHMLRLGWAPSFGGVLEAQLRTLANENYSSVVYERAYNGTLRYSRPFGRFTVGAEVFAGRDVMGEDFSRVGAFFQYTGDAAPVFVASGSGTAAAADKTAELFVEAGVSGHNIRIDLDPAVQPVNQTSIVPHVAIGARRAVSDRSDLGARLELDEVDGHTLTGLRIIDYRYRFANPLALGVFIGAARYDLATPAYGFYYGLGLEWRDVRPGWDVSLEARQVKKAARDNLVEGDPFNPVRPDSFYTIDSVSLSLVKRF